MLKPGQLGDWLTSIDLVLTRRVRRGQPLERRRLVSGVVIDVQVGVERAPLESSTG